VEGSLCTRLRAGPNNTSCALTTALVAGSMLAAAECARAVAAFVPLLLRLVRVCGGGLAARGRRRLRQRQRHHHRVLGAGHGGGHVGAIAGGLALVRMAMRSSTSQRRGGVNAWASMQCLFGGTFVAGGAEACRTEPRRSVRAGGAEVNVCRGRVHEGLMMMPASRAMKVDEYRGVVEGNAARKQAQCAGWAGPTLASAERPRQIMPSVIN
jgi:hypothetical protein